MWACELAASHVWQDNSTTYLVMLWEGLFLLVECRLMLMGV
jgi:hypothetical protein